MDLARLGIISAYPDDDWHSRRIVAAAAERASVDVLAPADFAADVVAGRPTVRVRGELASRWDVFLTPRALGEEGDHELQVELYRMLSDEGALVVNDVRALLRAIDKLRTSWLLSRGGVATPHAIVVQREEGVGLALSTLGGRVVVKPLYGSLGVGVELVDGRGDQRTEAEARLVERLQQRKALYVQAYIEGGGRDLRVFVVGGKVAAAITRVAPPGEFRTNVHVGGRAEPARPGAAAARMAVTAARLLGLDYAGVDLVEGPAGPVVLEVNGTPLFRGILEATGRDMAEAIVDHAIARVTRRRRRERKRVARVKSERTQAVADTARWALRRGA